MTDSERSDIEALFDGVPGPKKNRCKRCGETTAAMVVIGIREKGRAGRQRSRTASFCATHAVEAFKRATETIE